MDDIVDDEQFRGAAVRGRRRELEVRTSARLEPAEGRSGAGALPWFRPSETETSR